MPNLSEIEYRPLNLMELNLICSIELEVSAHPWGYDIVKRELEREKAINLGAFIKEGVENPLLGFAFSYLVCDELHILNIGVSSDFRRKGIARHLISAIFERALMQECRLSTLEVRRTNIEAQNLYLSSGFHFSGIRRGYYSNNGEDALLMERVLSHSS